MYYDRDDAPAGGGGGGGGGAWDGDGVGIGGNGGGATAHGSRGGGGGGGLPDGDLATPPRGTHSEGGAAYAPDREAAAARGSYAARADATISGLGRRVVAGLADDGRAENSNEHTASAYFYAAVFFLAALLFAALMIAFVIKKIVWLSIALATFLPGALLVTVYTKLYPSSAGNSNANARVFLSTMVASIPTTAIQFGGYALAMILAAKVDDPNKKSLHPAVLAFFAGLYVVTSYVILSPIYLLMRRAAPKFKDAMEVVLHGLFAGLGFAALENVIWIVLMTISPFERPAASSFAMQICRAVLYVPIMGCCGLIIGANVAREHFLYERESHIRAILVPILISWMYSFLPVLGTGPWLPWALLVAVVFVNIVGFIYLHRGVLPPLVGHRFEAI
jgi:RsiW-degrading membrane proteinase PrsW (M82 family)